MIEEPAHVFRGIHARQVLCVADGLGADVCSLVR